MANIYIRRLLAGNNMPTATSMIDMLATLESRLGLGVGTNGAGTKFASSSNHISEIPYTSPDYDYSAPSSPHS